MIGIVNISEEKGVPYSRTGLQHYRVVLWGRHCVTLTEFTHNSEDGMAECLKRAAEALEGVDVDKKQDEFFKQILLELHREAQYV